MIYKRLLTYVKKSLYHHASSKQKYARGNLLPFKKKTLLEAIMYRTRFRNKYLKNKTDKNKRKYTKQRDYGV